MTELASTLSLGQMVKFLAATLHHRNVDLPFRNQKPWHMLFYRLKTECHGLDKLNFFDELVFDWDAKYPRSEELSDFLNALHFTANVTGNNPKYEYITVPESNADSWLEELSDLDNLKQYVDHAADIAMEEFSSKYQ